jgi:hypothetical protein
VDYVGSLPTPDSLTRTVENVMERWPMITEQSQQRRSCKQR